MREPFAPLSVSSIEQTIGRIVSHGVSTSRVTSNVHSNTAGTTSVPDRLSAVNTALDAA